MKRYSRFIITMMCIFASMQSARGLNLTITIDNIQYEYSTETGLTSLKKVPTDYVGGISIPETINDNGTVRTVTAIANNACKDCKKLTLVILPSTITTIGSSAFNGCTSLTSCNIPDNVKEIGSLAFADCAITAVSFPRSLTKLGLSAFKYCPIKDVVIPSSLTSIGNTPFSGCAELERITVENGNPKYDSRNGCNALIETSSKKIIQGSGSAFIPNGIAEIGESAFEDNVVLQAITIPSTVKKIGKYAFRNCESLWLVQFSEGNEEIGVSAFAGCTSLQSVNIPSTVKQIQYETNMDLKTPYNVFSNCPSLESISVAEGNDYYDSRNGCNAIVRKADSRLMSGCMNTIIPESVTEIASRAFQGCTTLTGIDIPGNVKEIKASAFSGCIGLQYIRIAEGVETISENAFYGCTSLYDISFSETLKTIGERAFNDCTSIRTLTIPSGVKYIGREAFYGCYNMETLYLHIHEEPINDGGIKIDWRAFSTGSLSVNSSLSTIYCFSEKPFYISNSAFYFGNIKVVLYVPMGTSELYRNDSNWSSCFDRFNQIGNWTRTIMEFDVVGINPAIVGQPNRQAIIYSTEGKRREHLEKGVNILKMSDNSTRKILMK